MKKFIKDLKLVSIERPHERHLLLKLTSDESLPEILPGQFVQVRIDGSKTTFLRRPISINFVDRELNQLWLLVQMVGEGTRSLAELKEGDTLNLVFPLGNGFSPVGKKDEKVLLVGGGVGVAPLLEYGKYIRQQGGEPVFLLGARRASDLLMLDHYRQYGEVYLTTEDGSMGEKGFVTQHSILSTTKFDRISTCGPKPMMMSVAKYAKQTGTPCEVSLENMMACGVGACLCCVEKTVKGNVCVCKQGPVFDINELTW